jgi:hypothetical protein
MSRPVFIEVEAFIWNKAVNCYDRATPFVNANFVVLVEDREKDGARLTLSTGEKILVRCSALEFMHACATARAELPLSTSNGKTRAP